MTQSAEVNGKAALKPDSVRQGVIPNHDSFVPTATTLLVRSMRFSWTQKSDALRTIILLSKRLQGCQVVQDRMISRAVPGDLDGGVVS